MNKRYILIIAATFTLLPGKRVSAQERIGLSLQSAIDSALRLRDEIRIQQINADYSRNATSVVGSRLLPQLTGDVDVRYNGELMSQLLPGVAVGNPNGPGRFIQLGTTYTTLGDLNLTIPVYSPADIGDKRIAGVQASYDQLNVRRAEIDIKVEVTQSYFNCLLDAERLNLAQTNATYMLDVYNMSKDQLNKGAILPLDLERTRINYENARFDYAKSESVYHLALSDLRYRMGVKAGEDLYLSDSLTGLYQVSKDISPDNTVLNRVEIKQQEIQERIYAEDIKKENRTYWPTISIYGNLTATNQNNQYTLFEAQYWFPYNYIGARATIALFDGFARQRTKNGYRLQMASASLTRERMQRDYQHDADTYKTSVLNDQRDLESQRNNLDSARQLYRLDVDRLQKGAIRATDLAASFYTLQRSETNYLSAIYTFLWDMVQYKRTLGIL